MRCTVIIAFRRLLSQLKPETAKKIGYDNAARLYFAQSRNPVPAR